MGDYKGRSDYGGKSKGKFESPALSGDKGKKAMPSGGNITSREGGKGGVASPSLQGDKGKGKMSQKGGVKSDKRAHIIGG